MNRLRIMLRWQRFNGLVLIGLVVSGCAAQTGRAPFAASVSGTDSVCSVRVAGQEVTSDQLLAIARQEAKRTRRALLAGGTAVPYRCIGGVIYTLQSAGFRQVDFGAEANSDKP